MKTIEEIKHRIAVEKGYEKWQLAIDSLSRKLMFSTVIEMENEAMQEYAKQCCDEQIKACYNQTSEIGGVKVILSTPNVVTLKTK